ncbi:MAG: aminoglycoside phosphotransferase family protein [bacterium]|nr:aminoglycoside phosphotransferase family protein [bacterium]
MNKINSLLDQKFVLDFFMKEIQPKYPQYPIIKKISLNLVKNNIWTTTYHVVIEYKAVFSDTGGKRKTLPIYCTAHSDEPRLNSFEATTFLWQSGFNRGNLTMPRPLLYSPYFNAFFYQGLKGENLYHFIRHKNLSAVESITAKTAAWFAKLHRLPAERAKNFNPLNSRVETIIPGMAHALAKVKEFYPRYYEVCRQAYEIINRAEKNFFASTEKRWLIHGDAHPENIISISQNKIGVIDFTDICLADFARDLGAFTQQLEFMAQNKIQNPAYVEKIKKLFLSEYLKNAKLDLDDSLKGRVANYYHWTALRTAIFFLLKDRPEPERAHGLLIKISCDLNLNINI